MRLVMLIQTKSCTHAIPFEYDSLETAKRDFEATIHGLIDWNETCYDEFSFAGIKFFTRDFVFDEYVKIPEIVTLEVWFNKNNIETKNDIAT